MLDSFLHFAYIRFISKEEKAVRRKAREDAKRLREERQEQYKEHKRMVFERYLSGDSLCCKRGCLISYSEEKKESARFEFEASRCCVFQLVHYRI